MIIYPAIDLLDGKGVRLKKGDYQQVTIYGEPRDLLERWQAKGSKWLHLVDLNAAKQAGNNRLIIQGLLQSEMNIQIGGGIRTLEDAEYYLKAGANRVILGTVLLKKTELVKELIEKYPDQIVVGVDAKNGFVAVEGWEEVSSVDAIKLLKELESYGAKRVIYTDIAKDGMMSGPNFTAYENIKRETGLEVIASGGITTKEDLNKLQALGVEGAIIGKALYEGTIALEEVLC